MTARATLLVLALAAGLFVPAIDASAPAGWPAVETVVEGHTVFAVVHGAGAKHQGYTGLPLLRAAPTPAPPVPKVEGLAGEGPSLLVERHPGVRWFNDQFLTHPTVAATTRDGDGSVYAASRYASAVAVLALATDPDGITFPPCGGAVMLVNQADPDPRVALTDQARALGARFAYRDSSLVTDPNDHRWIIDRYELRTGTHASTVLVVNIGGSAFRPDLGDACPARLDTPAARQPTPFGYCYDGQSSYCEAFDGAHPPGGYRARAYNALFHVPQSLLTVPHIPSSHAPGSEHLTNGCHTGSEWECPWGDDALEGHSHPFRVSAPPRTTAASCPIGFAPESPANHGGSTRTDAVCDDHHATFGVDVYFSGTTRPLEPAVRSFALLDTAGSDAPWADTPSG